MKPPQGPVGDRIAARQQTFAPIVADMPGGKIFTQICAACHLSNGRGVSGMQPVITTSAVVAGDPNRLIDVLLQGPGAVLPAEREKFPNVMPTSAS